MLRFGLVASGVASVMVLSTVAAKAQSRDLWLYNGDSVTVEGYFLEEEGIYGWCDEDCYDLDLFLYDTAGNLVWQDTAADANPQVYAPYEGNFIVEVTMPNCDHPEGCAVWVDSDAGF